MAAKLTIDDIRKLAEDAKAWRPCVGCYVEYIGDGEHILKYSCGRADCDACLGAKRAVDDIGTFIAQALHWCGWFAAPNTRNVDAATWQDNQKHSATLSVDRADGAARIASYFTSEPNPVSIFRDAVKEFVA